MSLNFIANRCVETSAKKKFGLCDDPPPAISPAYIDEDDGSKWIAVVENESRKGVAFTAIDHCPDLELKRDDGKDAPRCDGLLHFDSTVIFVELKSRDTKAAKTWIQRGCEQLVSTIQAFEKTAQAPSFNSKKAYISNRLRRWVPTGQAERIAKFKDETDGYVLRIDNRINI